MTYIHIVYAVHILKIKIIYLYFVLNTQGPRKNLLTHKFATTGWKPLIFDKGLPPGFKNMKDYKIRDRRILFRIGQFYNFMQ